MPRRAAHGLRASGGAGSHALACGVLSADVRNAAMLTQLTVQDAAYLYMETPETPAHAGGLSHGQALNITVESYCDRLDFGLTACRTAVPDVAQLGDLLPVALDELRRAVLPDPAADVRRPAVVTPPVPVGWADAFAQRAPARAAGASA